MLISKKERSLSVWIGIALGVALSSMLVRYALQKKAEQVNERSGNYKSLKSASDGSLFAPIPESIRSKIPNGIVVYFENNQTKTDKNSTLYYRSWTIETTGSFRSERLFVWCKEISTSPSFTGENDYQFYRASELYILPKPNVQVDNFNSMFNEDEYKMIGKNSKTGEWILQIKDFTPDGIRRARQFFSRFETIIAQVNLIPWTSNL